MGLLLGGNPRLDEFLNAIIARILGQAKLIPKYANERRRADNRWRS